MRPHASLQRAHRRQVFGRFLLLAILVTGVTAATLSGPLYWIAMGWTCLTLGASLWYVLD